jgi:hypothetical protein
MNLEKQQPDKQFSEMLLKQEEENLLNGPMRSYGKNKLR